MSASPYHFTHTGTGKKVRRTRQTSPFDLAAHTQVLHHGLVWRVSGHKSPTDEIQISRDSACFKRVIRKWVAIATAKGID